MKVKRGSRTYYLIQNTKTRDVECIERFGSVCYAYDFFEKLIAKLKQVASGHGVGFWYNRNIILRLADKLVILVEDNEAEDIVAFYVLQNNGEIVFFQVFDEGKGIGRWLIERERDNSTVELFVRDITPGSILFWQRMGVPIRADRS